jgi:hypothetical protein
MNSILLDFPNNLHNISGDTLLLEGETDHFSSSVLLPGAIQCQITRYHSHEDTTASWEATMFRSESFQKAAGTYHTLYKQLIRCFALLSDGSLARLNGEWHEPDGNLPFTVSTLKLSTVQWKYRKMEVELELRSEWTGWVVSIYVVSKEKDDVDHMK